MLLLALKIWRLKIKIVRFFWESFKLDIVR